MYTFYLNCATLSKSSFLLGTQSFNCIKLNRNQWIMEFFSIYFAVKRGNSVEFVQIYFWPISISMSMWKVFLSQIFRVESNYPICKMVFCGDEPFINFRLNVDFKNFTRKTPNSVGVRECGGKKMDFFPGFDLGNSL